MDQSETLYSLRVFLDKIHKLYVYGAFTKLKNDIGHKKRLTEAYINDI